MKRHCRWVFPALIAGLALTAGCSRRAETPTGYEMTQDNTGVAPAATATRYSVGMAGDVFTPVQVVAPPGATISFINNCHVPHTVTPDASDVTSGPNSDAAYPQGVQPGQVYQWVIPVDATTGTTWYYHCRFHGQPGNGQSLGTGMAGSVTVGATQAGVPSETGPEVPTGTTQTAPRPMSY